MEEREEKLNRSLSHSNHIADHAEELCENLDKVIDAAKHKEEEKGRSNSDSDKISNKPNLKGGEKIPLGPSWGIFYSL